MRSFRTKLVVETEHASFKEAGVQFTKRREVYVDLSTDFSTSNKLIINAHKLEPTAIESRPSPSGYIRKSQNHKAINDCNRVII